jgi:hypothetical protein
MGVTIVRIAFEKEQFACKAHESMLRRKSLGRVGPFRTFLENASNGK